MSLIIPELIVPSDETFSLFDTDGELVDGELALFNEELLESRVAIRTRYSHEGSTHYTGPVHIGHVSLLDEARGIAHIERGQQAATLIVPAEYTTPIALNPETPNFTTLLAVRSLFYVLPYQRRQL